MNIMNVGDIVKHIGFPPAMGKVLGFIPQVNNPAKVAVSLDNERMFWDTEDKWVVIQKCCNENKEDYEDYVEVDEN